MTTLGLRILWYAWLNFWRNLPEFGPYGPFPETVLNSRGTNRVRHINLLDVSGADQAAVAVMSITTIDVVIIGAFIYGLTTFLF